MKLSTFFKWIIFKTNSFAEQSEGTRASVDQRDGESSEDQRWSDQDQGWPPGNETAGQRSKKDTDDLTNLHMCNFLFNCSVEEIRFEKY